MNRFEIYYMVDRLIIMIFCGTCFHAVGDEVLPPAQFSGKLLNRGLSIPDFVDGALTLL